MKLTTLTLFLAFVSFSLVAETISLEVSEGQAWNETVNVTLDKEAMTLEIDKFERVSDRIVHKYSATLQAQKQMTFLGDGSRREGKVYSAIGTGFYNADSFMIKVYVPKDKSFEPRARLNYIRH